MGKEQPTRHNRRFQLALFIVHPNVDPAEITAALKLEGQFQHRFGDKRRTPKGTVLPGTYSDTRWRYVKQHETDQHFADQITAFVNALAPYEAYFANLASTGGSIQIIIQFLGDGHYGDTIPRAVLARLNELGLDLGIEVFGSRQRVSLLST